MDMSVRSGVGKGSKMSCTYSPYRLAAPHLQVSCNVSQSLSELILRPELPLEAVANPLLVLKLKARAAPLAIGILFEIFRNWDIKCV